MFADALSLVTDLPRSPPDWRRLGAQLPNEWIEAALEYKGKASIRVRRLPAQQVVWLVIGLALYRHLSIKKVLDDLDLALPELEGRHTRHVNAWSPNHSIGCSRHRPRHGITRTALRFSFTAWICWQWTALRCAWPIVPPIASKSLARCQ